MCKQFSGGENNRKPKTRKKRGRKTRFVHRTAGNILARDGEVRIVVVPQTGTGSALVVVGTGHTPIENWPQMGTKW